MLESEIQPKTLKQRAEAEVQAFQFKVQAMQSELSIANAHNTGEAAQASQAQNMLSMTLRQELHAEFSSQMHMA